MDTLGSAAYTKQTLLTESRLCARLKKLASVHHASATTPKFVLNRKNMGETCFVLFPFPIASPSFWTSSHMRHFCLTIDLFGNQTNNRGGYRLKQTLSDIMFPIKAVRL